MIDDSGNLSIDFLAGFTVFMVAFIWVATMIPGLLIGVSGNAIDYDAVAYRTGVILVEDPGYTISGKTDWESLSDARKDEISRIGLSLSKETPNILSETKINRSFAPVFTYPDDYQKKVIFGDHPYMFNFSVQSFDGTINRTLGDVRPSNYGYIRRVVRIKEGSNATINGPDYISAIDVSNHVFSAELNFTQLLKDEDRTEYQIDPRDAPIAVNLTGLSTAHFQPDTVVLLRSANLSIRYAGAPAATGLKPDWLDVYVDGSSTPVKPTTNAPVNVVNDISIIFPSSADLAPLVDQYSDATIYVNFTFLLMEPGMVNPRKDRFINSTEGNKHFEYDYSPARVTQPELRPGIVEVAVW